MSCYQSFYAYSDSLVHRADIGFGARICELCLNIYQFKLKIHILDLQKKEREKDIFHNEDYKNGDPNFSI